MPLVCGWRVEVGRSKGDPATTAGICRLTEGRRGWGWGSLRGARAAAALNEDMAGLFQMPSMGMPMMRDGHIKRRTTMPSRRVKRCLDITRWVGATNDVVADGCGSGGMSKDVHGTAAPAAAATVGPDCCTDACGSSANPAAVMLIERNERSVGFIAITDADVDPHPADMPPASANDSTFWSGGAAASWLVNVTAAAKVVIPMPGVVAVAAGG
jgi:hypothetical protein